MSGEILFLAHRLPFPTDRGDKIRSHHILMRLAEIVPVHVATFADEEADWAYEGDLARIASTHCLVKRAKPIPIAGLDAVIRGEPVSLAAFRNGRIRDYVSRTLAQRPIQAIYVFSGQMGQYIPHDFPGRVVMDLVDVDSAKFEAYAGKARWPMNWINRREGRLLRAEESRLAARADQTLLVSQAEADLLRSRLCAYVTARCVSALGNGIDAQAFDPGRTRPEPAIAKTSGPHLIFTGQMDYPPNVVASLRVIERILPAVRQRHPQAQFHIVGRAPTKELRGHDGKAGVRVWGGVPDMRPFLAAADMAIVPLEIARGVQNKVLEAMAMALPVVLSPGAATGIHAEDGVHFAVEENDTALVARILSLLADRDAAQTLGNAARQFVLESQSWPAMLADLPRIMGFSEDCPGQQGSRDVA